MILWVQMCIRDSTRGVQYALKHYGIHVDDLSVLKPFVGPPLFDSFKRYYNFSDKDEMCIRDRILGRICMDQFMVDLTGIPEAKEGDSVTLVGRDGNQEITMEELAEILSLIHI